MFMLSLALLHSPVAVYAADDDEDSYLEEDDSDKGRKSKKKSTKAEGQVREIVRGFYAKAHAGASLYILPPFSQAVSSGTLVNLAVGQDFVDNERSSMAWEIGIAQGLHNGADWELQAGAGCGIGAPCTEGDLRTYSLTVNYEASYYVSRRVGIGVRAGGGVLYSPLLMSSTFYAENVVGDFGGEPGYHNSPKPVVFGGPTLEYYTKLSHFSLGVDVDVSYGIGWSMAVNASGGMKYTF
jgi:hypothetical protein